MGSTEMSSKQDEAVRHLRMLRQLHSKGASTHDLICSRPTMEVGAALLRAAGTTLSQAPCSPRVNAGFTSPRLPVPAQ
eukprot:3524865-Pleurochrysis_carterae.AAC.1